MATTGTPPPPPSPVVNSTASTNSTTASDIVTTETPQTTPPPPVVDYVWDYIASMVGGQTTLPPIFWFTTVLLLSVILYCYRWRPHLLVVPKKGLSATILLVFINHLVNNSVFLFSTYVINTVVNYNRAVFDASKWLNTWYHSLLITFCNYIYVL